MYLYVCFYITMYMFIYIYNVNTSLNQTLIHVVILNTCINVEVIFLKPKNLRNT